jgi:DNA polymerase/3'-5' exonuclease PolX
MSDKPKYPLAEARRIGLELVELLRPYVERIEIVGSVRRERPFVSDVEILFIPKLVPKQRALFAAEASSMTDVADLNICRMKGEGILKARPNVDGYMTWGLRNKLAIHAASGLPVDLFACDGDCWWNSLVVRTGGKQSNIQLASAARRRGWGLEAYGAGFKNLRAAEHHQTTSEADVFEFVGMKCLPPNQRP